MSEGFAIVLDYADLAGIVSRVENLDLSPIQKKMGERLTNREKIRFQLGIDPEGKPWIPSKKLQKTRGVSNPKRRGKTLIGSTRRLSLSQYSIEGDLLLVGPPPLPYAAIHQFGGQAGRGRKVTIPARPYMDTELQEDDYVFLQRAIAKAIMS